VTVKRTFEAIVVGLGAIGSAAVAQLARRGLRVLGLEMFQPAHDQGSSHGYHRMIRTSSLADDGYVPLAERAFALWRELEAETGEALLAMVGEVWLYDAANQPHLRDLAARTIHRGFREPLNEDDLAARFPGFRLGDGMAATYEAQAG
jgi:sarcosine oxidase